MGLSGVLQKTGSDRGEKEERRENSNLRVTDTFANFIILGRAGLNVYFSTMLIWLI